MYQMFFRNILLLLMLSMTASMVLVTPTALALTAEEKQAKKDDKNLASIEKQLGIIEEKLKEQYGGKAAAKAAKSAVRTYKRLSDSAKAASETSGFKERFDELTTQAEAKSKRDVVVKKDLKYLKTAIKALDKLEGQVASETTRISDAKRTLRTAAGSLSKISAESLEEKEFSDAEARLNALSAQVEGEGARLNAAGSVRLEIAQSRQSYETYANNIPMLVSFAVASGLTTQLDETYGFKQFKDAYDAADFGQLEKAFREKYAALIKNVPDYHKGRTLSPTQILDMYNKPVEYRNNYILYNGKKTFNEKLSELDSAYKRLNDKGSMQFDLSELYGSKEDKPYAILIEIEQYYDWAGQTLPSDEVKKLTDYKDIIRDAIDFVASKNEWSSSDYPYKNDNMEDLAEGLCKQNDSAFVQVGVTGENNWSINKNVLDIPTSRDQDGLILCQHPDEPFKRGYLATFNGIFNGAGYEPISKGSIYGSPTPYQ